MRWLAHEHWKAAAGAQVLQPQTCSIMQGSSSQPTTPTCSCLVPTPVSPGGCWFREDTTVKEMGKGYGYAVGVMS